MRWNWPSNEAIFGSPFDPGVGSSALHRETIPIAFHHLAEKIPARIRLRTEGSGLSTNAFAENIGFLGDRVGSLAENSKTRATFYYATSKGKMSLR
jgi:hypothetical protein